jgi:hypothetical protein
MKKETRIRAGVRSYDVSELASFWTNKSSAWRIIDATSKEGGWGWSELRNRRPGNQRNRSGIFMSQSMALIILTLYFLMLKIGGKQKFTGY